MRSDACVFANKLLVWGTSPIARVTKISSFTHICCPKLIVKNQTCNFRSWFFIEEQNIDSFTWNSMKVAHRTIVYLWGHHFMTTKVTDMSKDSFYAQRIVLLFESSLVPICFPWISENRTIKLFWKSHHFLYQCWKKRIFLGNKRISETWNITYYWFFVLAALVMLKNLWVLHQLFYNNFLKRRDDFSRPVPKRFGSRFITGSLQVK